MSKLIVLLCTVVVRTITLGLMCLGLANTLGGFFYPLELETREGTIWLHVLAMKAGINLYDHSKVAFVNMNHGPLEPILKTIVASLLPFLAPAQVARFFALLLPPVTFYFAWLLSRKKPWDALLISSTMYLLWLALGSYFPLVGRSDPTAILILTLFASQAWPYLSVTNAQETKKLTPVRMILLGATGGLLYLTNWRYLPVALLLMILSIFNVNMSLVSVAAIRMLLQFLSGFFVPVLLVLGLVFKFDFGLYYRHFFAFFRNTGGGWGIKQRFPFSYFPHALIDASGWSLQVLFILCASAAVPFLRSKNTVLWLSSLSLAWVLHCYGYYRNSTAGGPYYFAPMYILIALFLAVYLPKLKNPFPFWRELFCVMALYCLPLSFLNQQVYGLFKNIPVARRCLAEMRGLIGSSEVLSEDLQFYKSVYSGETVDMGDTVEWLVSTGFFDPAFSVSANRYFDRLRFNPPAFLMRGAVTSDLIRDVSKARYELAYRCEAPLFVNGTAVARLLRRIK